MAACEAAPIPGTAGFDALSYRETDELGIVRFMLQVGCEIPSHEMPFEVCFLVLSGGGILRCGNEEIEVDTGWTAICPSGITRSWRNTCAEPLSVLVLKLKNGTFLKGDILITRKIDEQPPAKNPHGVDVRRAYESEHALSSVVTLMPGDRLLRHITPVDVFFYVLEGSGFVEVGDEKVQVEKDTVIDSPKDIPHCWYNEGTEILRFLVVKVPKPTSGSILL